MTDAIINVTEVTQSVVITQPVVTVQVGGVAGVKGDKGIDGTSVVYTHNQTTPATTWTVNHNLGRYPSIQTLTVGQVEFDADIAHTSINQAIITLAIATAGIAQCN